MFEMVDTKSRGYSNSGRLSEGEYSVPFFSTRLSPTNNHISKCSFPQLSTTLAINIRKCTTYGEISILQHIHRYIAILLLS